MIEINKNTKVPVPTGVKAGGLTPNDGTRVESPKLRVRTGMKAAGPGLVLQHGVRVRQPSR
jgi:hypothetical protein